MNASFLSKKRGNSSWYLILLNVSLKVKYIRISFTLFNLKRKRNDILILEIDGLTMHIDTPPFSFSTFFFLFKEGRLFSSSYFRPSEPSSFPSFKMQQPFPTCCILLFFFYKLFMRESSVKKEKKICLTRHFDLAKNQKNKFNLTEFYMQMKKGVLHSHFFFFRRIIIISVNDTLQ